MENKGNTRFILAVDDSNNTQREVVQVRTRDLRYSNLTRLLHCTVTHRNVALQSMNMSIYTLCRRCSPAVGT